MIFACLLPKPNAHNGAVAKFGRLPGRLCHRMSPAAASALAFAAALLLAGNAMNTARAETLIDTVDIALAHNPSLLSQRFLRDARGTERRQARAALLPQLQFSYQLQQQRDDLSNSALPTTPNFSASYRANSSVLQLNQAVFNKASLAALRAVEGRIDDSELRLLQSTQNLLLDTANAWFDLATANDRISFNWSELQALAGQLERAQAEYDVGEGDRLALEETRARHDLARADALLAQQNQLLARERLRELTGVPITTLPPIAEREIKLPFSSLESALEAAKISSPELELARNVSRQASDNITIRKAGHYPTLNLFAQRNFNDTSDSPIGQERETLVYGLQLDLPVFSGWRVSAEIDQAQFEAQSAGQEMEVVRRSVERRVRAAWLSIESASARQRALELAVRSATTALESTEASQQAGLRSNIDVLDARQNRLRARTEHSTARYELLRAQLRLIRATGQLDRDVIVSFNQVLSPLTLQRR